MEDNIHHDKGYTTKAALMKLRNDIGSVIDEHKIQNRMGICILWNIISLKSEKVLVSGIAYTVTIINIICLILTYLIGGTLLAQGYLLWEALFLFVLLVINICIAANEEYLYRNEIPYRVKKVLETLDRAVKKCSWKEHHYPHLCAPFSPCVILQWTYRDGVIVNLPWALLVEGDIIVLRPGQEVPGHCQGLSPGDPELFFGQIFLSGSQTKEHFSAPRVRTPHPNKTYRMCETPYLKNLRLALNQATARPVTVFEKQRYLCTVKILEGIVLPIVISLMAATSVARHLCRLPGTAHWTEIYLLQIAAASVPLLQIFFPIAWVTLNCYGLARFKLLSETRQIYTRPKSCSISEEASDPLIKALSESNLKMESLRSLSKTFWNILIGREDMVTRTANIVHVLGSLSTEGSQPGGQTGNQPSSKSDYQPGSKSDNQPGSKPDYQPSRQLGNQPEYQPGSQPEGQAGNQPDYQPGGQAGNQPGRQPGNQPDYQPGSHPAILGASQAAIQPSWGSARQPSWGPARQPSWGPARQTQTSSSPLSIYFSLNYICDKHALCCVDKKGVLSWPNPTAEKVFFLRNSSPTSHNSSKTSLVDSMGHQSHSNLDQVGDTKPNAETSTIVEVLDLTHDQNAPFRVEFDEQRWRTHLARLKPLGLAALLNTCAQAPRHTYAHFCAHLTCEAHYSEDLVPVTNRRCLCELAKQIGFTDSVANSYSVQECLAVFRHLQADTIRRETRFVRSLHLSTRVKVPLPHMLAVLVKDHSHQLQMLTQGTADIILDSCVDYWNGRDLTPISPSDRKKIIDFYQRNSLTAYCTAFAYKPLTRGISSTLAQQYLELPADSRSLYAPHSHDWPDAPALHFHSTDSLLFNEITDDDVSDADGYFDMQCNQVFIGMVTMQYQAQSDMVELIERLERACIRFVHFSKENELRSRVFSEKMGLESGWNCHISLMSDRPTSKPGSPLSSQTLGRERGNTASQLTRPDTGDVTTYSGNISSSKVLSMSAPGAINVEHTTVKFDDEIKKTRHSLTTHQGLKLQRGSVATSQASTDSLLNDDAEDTGESPPDACRSLSCLTDSTDHSAPLNFDMSNRAKLPRGIENIRPHIEQVDNVPLLVSLFTDCTANSVHRMIQIMQDYGEVVCVMGSAANCQNMEIFMQADASIAMEPLYPVLCQKMPPYQVPQTCIGPIDLARSLNSVPCSLSLARAADVSLFALITMSRHFTMCLWNTTQFWICSACFLSLIQVMSVMCYGIGALTVGGATWCSLMALFIFWCYGCKFLPSIVSILLLYGLTLRNFCEQIAEFTNSTSCWLVYPVNAGNSCLSEDLAEKSWHGWGDEFYDGLYLAQHITLALVTLHLVIISLSFVHRHSSIWQRRFWSNRVWSTRVVLIILIQGTFSGLLLRGSYGQCGECGACELRYTPAWPLCGAYAGSLLLVFLLNELIKWQEIKADARNQRRARLDFGTKLGMNSPF
ncbi:jg20482 [Pararge aegeria aegeria]|uniref:Jg20482 protein n=1 Tax=Pararge aegeria aegeria TaxID=348720 RepID=A0A8S4RSC3_9NEOP|nr:jg20482 [Pararge aegeria aegeria]